MHQILDQLVPGEQGLHLDEALLQVFGIGQLGFFAHGAVRQKVRHFSTGPISGFLQNHCGNPTRQSAPNISRHFGPACGRE